MFSFPAWIYKQKFANSLSLIVLSFSPLGRKRNSARIVPEIPRNALGIAFAIIDRHTHININISVSIFGWVVVNPTGVTFARVQIWPYRKPFWAHFSRETSTGDTRQTGNEPQNFAKNRANKDCHHNVILYRITSGQRGFGGGKTTPK